MEIKNAKGRREINGKISFSVGKHISRKFPLNFYADLNITKIQERQIAVTQKLK